MRGLPVPAHDTYPYIPHPRGPMHPAWSRLGGRPLAHPCSLGMANRPLFASDGQVIPGRRTARGSGDDSLRSPPGNGARYFSTRGRTSFASRFPISTNTKSPTFPKRSRKSPRASSRATPVVSAGARGWRSSPFHRAWARTARLDAPAGSRAKNSDERGPELVEPRLASLLCGFDVQSCLDVTLAEADVGRVVRQQIHDLADQAGVVVGKCEVVPATARSNRCFTSTDGSSTARASSSAPAGTRWSSCVRSCTGPKTCTLRRTPPPRCTRRVASKPATRSERSARRSSGSRLG